MSATKKSVEHIRERIKEEKLYENIVQKTERNSHYYYHKDSPDSAYPSVTTYLNMVPKFVLQAWRDKMIKTTIDALFNDAELFSKDDVMKKIDIAWKAPDEYRDQSVELGNRVHAFIEEWVAPTGKPVPELSDEERTHTSNAVSFLQNNNISPVAAEIPIFREPDSGDIPGYGGTVDFLGVDDKKDIWLVDWKTGGLYDYHTHQTAAYGFALGYLLNMHIDHMVTFSTKQNKAKEAKPMEDFLKFCTYAKVYSYTHKREIYS